MLDLSDMQKIGVGLTGFGTVFIFLGVMLFFDRGLLAMGNILFVAGICFIIGMARTYSFFFQGHKLKGTAFFFAGIFLVLIGWPFIGMLVESYGFFLLFRGIFPHAISFLRRAPVIGIILNLPGINRMGKQGSRLQNRVTAKMILTVFGSLTASFASTVELYGTRGFEKVMA